jgi:uncharacterized protein (TIGR02646 family)
MKKIKKSPTIPAALDEYSQANPNDTWQQFKKNCPDGSPEIKAALSADQGGLCAYCEIDLAEYEKGHADFRADHFIPKTPHNPPPNHGLDWQNLRGVCSGGNSRYIGDPARFTQPDYCCDEPKGNNNWTGFILDPLHDIPAFPPLFEFSEDGNMEVSKACPTHLQKQAQASINLLRLSPTPDKDRPDPRLIRFRKAAITKLRQQIQAEVDGGMDFEAALAWFAEVNFPDSAAVTWPAFFSCIRWYLGDVAEQRLRAINYQG